MTSRLRAATTYENVYAALYDVSLELWHGDESMASYLTASTLAGAVMMNWLLAIGVVGAIVGPLAAFMPRWIVVVFPAVVLVGHYWLFIGDGRYQKIADRYRQRSDADRRRIAGAAWSYLILSYLLPVAFFFTMAARIGK